MILRPARRTLEDCLFIVRCFEDAPESDITPVLLSDAKRWIHTWLRDNDEFGLIGVETELVSLVIYSKETIHNLIVHPDYRGMGYGSLTWRLLFEKLTEEGRDYMDFEAIPGLIADLTVQGRFAKVGEGVGTSGLPIVKGRVTADMEV